jgi:hypothetical protein
MATGGLTAAVQTFHPIRMALFKVTALNFVIPTVALREACKLFHPIRMTFFKGTALNFVIPTGGLEGGVQTFPSHSDDLLQGNRPKLCHPDRSEA